jgi:hypothetical protein
VRFTIIPSPCEAIVLTPYNESVHPQFRPLFEPPLPSSPLRFLALNRAEAPTAIVLENRSGKALTARCCRWIRTGAFGKQKPHTFSSDSHTVDVYRPIVEAGTRRIMTQSGEADETIIDRMAAGGGVVAGGSSRVRGNEAETVELTFQIDFILFEDGEIAGSDPALCRSAALPETRAEFVAKQIRLAQAEDRDVTPVLSALVDIPLFGSLHREQGDRLVQWTQYYARECLRRIQPPFLSGNSLA